MRSNVLLKFHQATEAWVAAAVYLEQLNVIRICDIAEEQPNKVVPERKHTWKVWYDFIVFFQAN